MRGSHEGPVTVVRRMATSASAVFEAWTQPALLRQWAGCATATREAREGVENSGSRADTKVP
jgi:uncharacterized protein YndB with AHSA1/START domain